MKSKKTTYLLLAAALIVWGIVLYKVLFPKTAQKELRIPAPVAKNKTPDKKDSLWLNYRDPFLGNIAISEKVSIEQKDFTANVSWEEKTDKKPVGDLCYYGRITTHNQTYCLICIGNEHHQMEQGDIRDGFKLTHIYEDSVYFEKQGEVYCIGLLQ